MANRALALSLLILSLSPLMGSMAQLETHQEQLLQSLRNQQQHRLRAKTPCGIQQLQAREPTHKHEYEAGSTEFWDASGKEFACAGIQFVRHTIQPKGLLLPYYTNAPQLVYIIKGSGIQETVIPGCAETYESGSSSYSASESEREKRQGEQGQGRRANDRHQKLRRFRQGDILALQPGVTNWAYNDGDTPIISVSIRDVASEANQLDLEFRKFLLAGNPQATRNQGPHQEEEPYRDQQSKRGEQEGEEQQQSNIFAGFEQEFLAEVLNIDPDIIRRLQGKEDNRGAIIRAENLGLVLPEWGSQEQEREGGYANGLEETLCSLKIRENIEHPSKADVYNPRAGRVTRLNGHKLPILNHLRLSADRGILYRNAMMAPHWSINSHTITYVIRGSARIQVVGNQGKTVYDEEIQEGQLLVVPQNFATVKKAGESGFEWIAFRTNHEAMIGQLAGRLSAIRAMPEEVLMNVYSVSRKDAGRLKNSREEATLLGPTNGGPQRPPQAENRY
ncbi:12S seed storage protein CRA1 [Striga hermonthica]|uniref:12S seed storage protein CRA1 n=1 Tax=Striga hermonthica TaxID=68872 RepID=A0A9N7MS98_STRHE|nr:12S seed storage protein CRA1 [Striga hermonthica]